MKTMTTSEAIEWSKCQKLNLDARQRPAISDGFRQGRFEIPKSADRQLWFCRFIERSLRPWSRCLLWVTQWGVWESSENWHLYYRLRQSYGDMRLLEQTPAHLFLDYENHDLVSFLQVALGAGWDFSVLTHEGYAHVVVSHDEWVEFSVQDHESLRKIEVELALR